MKITLIITALALGTLTSFMCDGPTRASKGNTEAGGSNKECSPPVMQIEVNPTLSLKRPLEMRWKITNVGSDPVYVYSTLLKKTNFVEVDINAKEKVIEVRVLRLQPFGISPNYFPDTEFVKIDPGLSHEGRFISYGPARQVVSYRSGGGQVKTEVIKPGEWVIRGLTAYGCEITSVQNAKNIRHPIDPIVEWQRVAYSGPVHVTFQK